MPFVNWDESLSVGVNAFDEDHRKLIGFINELHMGLVSGAKEPVMRDILNGLVNYTKEHFRREEDLMARNSYPALPEHREKHSKLVEQVMEYQSQFQKGNASFSLELMSFLREWLITHIQGTDKLYRDFFKSRGIT